MRRPKLYDFYCGLGGWTEAFLKRDWDCVGFDIERHDYGSGGYLGQLVLQDVRTIHGAQLTDADCLVASSPCQEFSWRAMPWKEAKAKTPQELGAEEPDWWALPEADMEPWQAENWWLWRNLAPREAPVSGIELFWQAFRIQQEIFEACGRWVPLIAENVRGAEKWVGPARWRYGSFYLWGDVPAVMPPALHAKVPAFRFDGSGRSFQTASVDRAGVKYPISGHAWYRESHGRFGSKSSARKAASAQIAKIPFPLADWIAQVYDPRNHGEEVA